MIKSLKYPIEGPVRLRYLRDMDPNESRYEQGKVIGLSSYEGECLTLEVLMRSNGLFSYLPLMALAGSLMPSNPCPIEDTYYFNCPKGKFFVHRLKNLYKQRVVSVYKRNGEYRGKGIYQFTIDWPEANQQGHIISMETNPILWPSHKLIFEPLESFTIKLPEYKKLRQTWKLPEKI